MTKLFKPNPPSQWCTKSHCILDAGHDGPCSPRDRRTFPRKGREARKEKPPKGR